MSFAASLLRPTMRVASMRGGMTANRAFRPIQNRMYTNSRSLALQNQARRRFCAQPTPKKKPTTDKPFVEQWMSEPGTYPIVIIIIGACALCAYKLGHDLMDPDVSITRKSRNKVSWLEDDEDIRKKRMERGQKLSDRRGHASTVKEED